MNQEKNIDDFIQQAVNKGYEESVNRWKKHINYKISQVNRKKKLNKIKRKQERQNKRNGRKRS